MAKTKALSEKIKVNFGKRKGGKHSKAKSLQPKKYRGQGR
jgi:cytoplasmic iron level regulating protein YaaA (DUF328/UPF0246 family)